MNSATTTERERLRFLLIIAIQSLSDALYKESRMEDDDEMGVSCLRSGAEATTHILNDQSVAYQPRST